MPGRPHGAVLAWLSRVDDAALRLSAVTLGEIQAGIEPTREQDPAKATEIERWLSPVEQARRELLPEYIRHFVLLEESCWSGCSRARSGWVVA